MPNITFNAEGITCSGCEKSIHNALAQRGGVNNVSANHETGTVNVDFDTAKIQRDDIKQAIQDAGFDVTAWTKSLEVSQ
jgi:copper chaperone